MNQSVIVSRNSRLVNTMYENLGLSEPNWVIINLSDTKDSACSTLPADPSPTKRYVSTVPQASRRPTPNAVNLSALLE
jgi:hypothetical protein